MKKTVIAVVVAVLLLAAAGNISFTVSRRIDIAAAMDEVAPQVTDVRNWKRWYPAGGWDTLLPVQRQAAAVSVCEWKRGKERLQTVDILPAMDGRSSEVAWTRRVSGWQWLTQPVGSEMADRLEALKGYMEDPRKLYGFEIGVRPVTDTLFVTRQAVVGEAEIAGVRPVLLDELRDYLAGHPEMGGQDSAIAGWEPLKTGLVNLVVGIPVNRPGPETDSIRFLRLPRGGRLLVGVLAGESTRIDSLRRAMDRYMVDKRLQLVAAPYEKWAGSRHELNYPIW
jgi:hypothetical protein